MQYFLELVKEIYDHVSRWKDQVKGKGHKGNSVYGYNNVRTQLNLHMYACNRVAHWPLIIYLFMLLWKRNFKDIMQFLIYMYLKIYVLVPGKKDARSFVQKFDTYWIITIKFVILSDRYIVLYWWY